MRNSKDNYQNSSENLFSYRNKNYIVRFFIVYWFYIQNFVGLLWHFKIRKYFYNEESYKQLELELYEKLGKKCKDLFLKMGGVYVKLGQFLSNLNHLLPLEFTNHLQDLQDRLPAHPFIEIKDRFEKETGRTIEDVFPDINPIPLAAASTAQVHVAYIDSKKVAVKILYPGIEKIVEKDMKTVRFVMKRINRYLFSFDYKTIYREVSEIISREMNLRQEADSIQKMARLFSKEKNIIFPEVYTQYTSKAVLVTQFIEGVKISDTITLRYKGNRKSRPLSLLMRAYILMIFKFRFFHADPHPGNLIYTPDEKLCFIDFGSVGTLQEQTEKSLRKIVLSIISKDYYGVVEGMDDMGFFQENVDKEKLEKVARFAIENLERFIRDTEYFQNVSFNDFHPEDVKVFLQQINTSLYDLLRIARIPKDYVMLERVFALLMGHAAWHDPYRSILDYVKQPFFSIVGGDQPRIKAILEEEGGEILADIVSIPLELHDTLNKLKTGRLYIRNKDVQRQTERFEILGKQIVYTMLAISLLHSGNFFLEKGFSMLSYLFYGFSSVFGYQLLSSLYKNR